MKVSPPHFFCGCKSFLPIFFLNIFWVCKSPLPNIFFSFLWVYVSPPYFCFLFLFNIFGGVVGHFNQNFVFNFWRGESLPPTFFFVVVSLSYQFFFSFQFLGFKSLLPNFLGAVSLPLQFFFLQFFGGWKCQPFQFFLYFGVVSLPYQFCFNVIFIKIAEGRITP